MARCAASSKLNASTFARKSTNTSNKHARQLLYGKPAKREKLQCLPAILKALDVPAFDRESRNIPSCASMKYFSRMDTLSASGKSP